MGPDLLGAEIALAVCVLLALVTLWLTHNADPGKQYKSARLHYAGTSFNAIY